MDSKMIIKEFNEYVDGFVECCTSDKQTHELLKAVAKLIEDQEERIAIMSEGGKHGHWIMTNMKNVYGGIVIKCSCCDSRVIVQDVDDEKYCRTCGASMDEPSKEGEA